MTEEELQLEIADLECDLIYLSHLSSIFSIQPEQPDKENP
jgi:hypothetical protein